MWEMAKITRDDDPLYAKRMFFCGIVNDGVTYIFCTYASSIRIWGESRRIEIKRRDAGELEFIYLPFCIF